MDTYRAVVSGDHRWRGKKNVNGRGDETMPDGDTNTALIPLIPDVRDLVPAHQEFQRRIFAERRGAVLAELRMLSGVLGLVKDLKPDKVYRLVVPEGRVLQQGKDGLYSGVLYGPDGKISSHARFEKVPLSLARMASAVGSQVLLVSIAMQLNRIEKAIAGIGKELHNDRIAEILAGIQQYEMAMHMTDHTRRDTAIQHAIQTLTEGLVKVRLELRTRIAHLPDPKNTFWDNWGGSKTQHAAKEFSLAEESFMAAVRGASVLSECYAVIDEPRAGSESICQCLRDIQSCGIQTAADRARIVEVQNQNYMPEFPWLMFCETHQDFIQKATRTPLDPMDLEQGSVAIEFKKSELLEET